MKKTKTGLHIDVKGKCIEVYTKKTLAVLLLTDIENIFQIKTTMLYLD